MYCVKFDNSKSTSTMYITAVLYYEAIRIYYT